MAYWEWGDAHNPRVLICVHGLTRCGRDFDTLARHLSGHYRVICPDVVGRGKSDWLVQPQYYTVVQYVADMLTLIARLGVSTFDWVGTSMGWDWPARWLPAMPHARPVATMGCPPTKPCPWASWC